MLGLVHNLDLWIDLLNGADKAGFVLWRYQDRIKAVKENF